ncbi:TPA: restriction endonuclease [Photobacterium damselae]
MQILSHSLTSLGLIGSGLACVYYGLFKSNKHLVKRKKIKDNKHSKNIAKSRLVISKINGITPDGAKINYLRKISPYVFEELLLTAYEHKGFTIIRNTSYSGDGGLDGQIVNAENGKRYLIQAKRYKGHIKRSHVIDFIKLCQSENCGGLFIHTGQTSNAIRDFARARNIQIISGKKLINVITCDA